MIRALRDEALRMLTGGSAILDAARDVSAVLAAADIDGAVIGGVAVVLHGYVRTTLDVDVYVFDPDARVRAALVEAGFRFSRAKREFVRGGVPVHLARPEDVAAAPRDFEIVEGVRIASLADLINRKLASGLRNPVRAIDLADVIGLIRCRRLRTTFAAKPERPLRADFRRLVRAVERS